VADFQHCIFILNSR